MVRRGQNNLRIKLRSALYIFTTRSLLILELLDSFCTIMTSERIQRLIGMLVDVAELMLVLWMASIVELKPFSLSLYFCPSSFSRLL